MPEHRSLPATTAPSASHAPPHVDVSTSASGCCLGALTDILEASERITSKVNLWADLGSREQISEVVRQAAALGFSERQLPLPKGWMEAFEAEWQTTPTDA